MYNTLTKDEVVKVFATYWGCRCQRMVTKTGLPSGDGDVLICGHDLMESLKNTNTWFYKIILTPLSEISDEHAKEVAILEEPRSMHYHTIERGRYLLKGFSSIGWPCYNYLISKGYAVPLWLGINHVSNGKTAIELDIALNSTTLNDKS